MSDGSIAYENNGVLIHEAVTYVATIVTRKTNKLFEHSNPTMMPTQTHLKCYDLSFEKERLIYVLSMTNGFQP